MKASAALRALLPAAAFVVVVAGMQQAAPILVPLLLAVFISVVSIPPLFWFQRRGLPRGFAVLVVVAVIVVAMVLMGHVVSRSAADFVGSLPTLLEGLDERLQALLSWLGQRGVDTAGLGFSGALDPASVMRLAGKVLRGLSGVLTNAFLIIVMVVFILLEASSFPAKLRATSDDPDTSLGYYRIFLINVQRYIAIKTLMSLLTGAAVTGLLLVMGVSYPFLWGLLAFLLNYVPTLGSIAASVPAILVALIELGAGAAFLTAGGYLAVNIGISNFMEPRVMGRELGLSALVVLLSLVFWGWIFGVVGMLLAVPLTMTVKIALDSNAETRWLALLLGSEAEAQKAASVSAPASAEAKRLPEESTP
jgi:AI-2 transport protein TqsA